MPQVSDFTLQDGVIRLMCGEALVSAVELRFLDAKTNELNPKPRTKPHIITRHLITRPGKVRCADHRCAALHTQRGSGHLPKPSQVRTRCACACYCAC